VRNLVAIVAAIVVVLGSVAAGLVWAFRTRFGPVMRTIRRVNRAVFNPMQLRGEAGQPDAYASVIHHLGRRSGTPYRTPVVAVEADGHLVVALPYGPETDWVRNLTVAGGGTVEHQGRRLTVGPPTPIPLDTVDEVFPTKEQRTHRRFGVRHALRLPIVAPSVI
jgi:deazaflavin-dependent oxidoreductase (nitroreductase family)